MKTTLLTTLLTALVAVIAATNLFQLGNSMIDIHQKTAAAADQAREGAIRHRHFTSELSLWDTKDKVDADFAPLQEKSEGAMETHEILKQLLRELRIMRVRIERDSELLALHQKYPHESW